MGLFSRRATAGGSIAGMLCALLIGTTFAPAAEAVDADDLAISGPGVVGSALSVMGAYEYFLSCDPSEQPSYSIQWLRNGQPVTTSPTYAPVYYDLDIEDVGSRISAIVTGASACNPARIVVEDPQVIRAQPMRAEGFTGRGVFELVGRRPDGVLMMYLGKQGAQGWTQLLRVGAGWSGYTRIIAPGDFTNDGVGDLLGTNSSGTLFAFGGTGDGGFATTYPYEIGWGWNAIDKIVGPGDFDGDGTNDLLGADANGDLYLYSQHKDSGWNPRLKVGQGWHVMDLIFAPGDFDGDGNVDVMAKDKEGRLFLYGGNGLGGWASARQIGQGWNALSNIGSVGDFNRDGFNDIHGVNAASDLVMYYGNGLGGWKGVETVGWGWGGFNGLY
ncbi:FG-GAP repeat domain-containing protein [Arthrobacter sp. alpha11c]